jgi:carboxymethylenebutenolidase
MFNNLTVLSACALMIGCAPVTDIKNTELMEKADSAVTERIDHEYETNPAYNLSDSPRHQEWVAVDNNGRSIHTFVVYPEVSEKAPVVLLIHENRGLNSWMMSMADQIAAEGYIAVAPDLLSDFSETQKRTGDFANEDAARDALYTLDSAQVISDMNAVVAYAHTIAASDGRIVSAGFCWGGSQSFALATANSDLSAALVFYGTAPEDQSLYANIAAPVYGFYGGNDERVNATIEQTEQFMAGAGMPFNYEIYDGAGHAFMRLGEDTAGEEANVQARLKAWERMKNILTNL